MDQKEFDERRFFAVTEYTRLKNDFLHLIEYIPLSQDHFKVYSPKLSSLITDACEQILDCLEILIQTPYNSKRLLLPGPEVFEKKRKHFVQKINDGKQKYSSFGFLPLFCFINRSPEFFGELSNVGDADVYVSRLGIFIQPFEDKIQTDQGPIPDWWGSYTVIKHDRYSARKEANLEIALRTLAGLFLLVTHPYRNDPLPHFFSMHQEDRLYSTFGIV